MPFGNLQKELDIRKSKSLYRTREVLTSPQQPHIVVDGKALLSFCSNDYLGLANHPEMVAAYKSAADLYGVGGGASHLVSGHSYHHHALEEELAAFTGRSRALLFCSGYMANLGTINALLSRGDAVFNDKLNHASLLDGGMLSGARFHRYLHCNYEQLEQKLADCHANRKLIVTDAVFSMDGDIADLSSLAKVAKSHDAWLMVDDAHGFGCLGEGGGGCSELYSMDEVELPVLMGTLGKALGAAGAFVAGSEVLIETLIQFSRSYIYTTSLPPSVAAAARVGLKLVHQEPWRRTHLSELIQKFKAGCAQLGLVLLNSDTAIQPIMIGSEEVALKISDQLRELGILVKAIRSPTVALHQARLRVTLSASHSFKDVALLLDALEIAIKENRVEY